MTDDERAVASSRSVYLFDAVTRKPALLLRLDRRVEGPLATVPCTVVAKLQAGY